MKQFHHVCITAHSEVLLRNTEDVAMMTNLSAMAAYRTRTDMLTDSQMSTHLHETVLSDNIGKFVYSQELALTRAFNYRYSRKGPLFDGKPFVLQLVGPRHMQMAMNYSLRQGLHHGQSETAFAYPWSTCNHLFVEERGLKPVKPAITGRSELRKLLPRNSDFPDNWAADENGILLRGSFEELTLVENWYGTARNYIYSMTRKSSNDWIAEQDKDEGSDPTVTLSLLENGYSPEDITSMLYCEGNSKFISRGMSDMNLCSLIDTRMLGRFGVSSVYQLDRRSKERIASELRFDVGIRSEAQISRCLVMGYNR